MRYRRTQKERHKLLKLYNETKTHYGVGVYYSNKRNRYVRCYLKKPGTKKFLKNQTNKKIRKDKTLYQGNLYRKRDEYWWKIY